MAQIVHQRRLGRIGLSNTWIAKRAGLALAFPVPTPQVIQQGSQVSLAGFPTGGIPPYSNFLIVSGAISGLSLNATNGNLVATLGATVTTANFTFSVRDSVGTTVNSNVTSVQVTQLVTPLVFNPPSNISLVQSDAGQNMGLFVGGGVSPYTPFFINKGSRRGVKISSAGILQATAAAPLDGSSALLQAAMMLSMDPSFYSMAQVQATINQVMTAEAPFTGVRLRAYNFDSAATYTLANACVAASTRQDLGSGPGSANYPDGTPQNVLWSGSSSVVVPAASTVPILGAAAFVDSDEVSLASLTANNADAGNPLHLPLLYARMYLSHATRNPFYAQPTIDFSTLTVTPAQRILRVTSETSGNYATAATINGGTTWNPSSCFIIPIFTYTTRAKTVMAIGDSLVWSQGKSWATKLVYAASTQALPMNFVVMGFNGRNSTGYLDYATYFINNVQVPDICIVEVNSPNDSNTTLVLAQAAWTRIANFLNFLQTKGVTPVLLQPLPQQNLVGTPAGWQYLDQQVVAYAANGGFVLDTTMLRAVSGQPGWFGGAPGIYTDDNASTGYHPNNAGCIAIVSAGNVAALQLTAANLLRFKVKDSLGSFATTSDVTVSVNAPPPITDAWVQLSAGTHPNAFFHRPIIIPNGDIIVLWNRQDATHSGIYRFTGGAWTNPLESAVTYPGNINWPVDGFGKPIMQWENCWGDYDETNGRCFWATPAPVNLAAANGGVPPDITLDPGTLTFTAFSPGISGGDQMGGCWNGRAYIWGLTSGQYNQIKFRTLPSGSVQATYNDSVIPALGSSPNGDSLSGAAAGFVRGGIDHRSGIAWLFNSSNDLYVRNLDGGPSDGQGWTLLPTSGTKPIQGFTACLVEHLNCIACYTGDTTGGDGVNPSADPRVTYILDLNSFVWRYGPAFPTNTTPPAVAQTSCNLLYDRFNRRVIWTNNSGQVWRLDIGDQAPVMASQTWVPVTAAVGPTPDQEFAQGAANKHQRGTFDSKRGYLVVGGGDHSGAQSDVAIAIIIPKP